MAPIRLLPILDSFLSLADIPRDETAGIAVMTDKCMPRWRANICVRPVEDDAAEEDHIAGL